MSLTAEVTLSVCVLHLTISYFCSEVICHIWQVVTTVRSETFRFQEQLGMSHSRSFCPSMCQIRLLFKVAHYQNPSIHGLDSQVSLQGNSITSGDDAGKRVDG